MIIGYFITKEMKEKLWFELGRQENQAQQIEIDPKLLSPEARMALGFTELVSIPLEDALEVDPEHEDIVRAKILSWLEAAPARKEKLNIKYRLEDLEKKRRLLQKNIRTKESFISKSHVAIAERLAGLTGEAGRLRRQAQKREEVAAKEKETWEKNSKNCQNELDTDLRPSLLETESLMDQLQARYNELS